MTRNAVAILLFALTLALLVARAPEAASFTTLALVGVGLLPDDEAWT